MKMLDERNFRFYGKNKIIELSVNETYFLSLLINKNRFVSFEEIAYELFDLSDDKYVRNRIRVFVSRLKAKLKDEVVIKSKRGFGYIIEK